MFEQLCKSANCVKTSERLGGGGGKLNSKRGSQDESECDFIFFFVSRQIN
jgi:hypothetical protein